MMEREVYKDPVMKGLEFHEVNKERYVIFHSRGGRVVWAEFYEGNKPTGRSGDMTGIEDKEAYKNFVIEQMKKSSPNQIRERHQRIVA
ncbi:MAG: hypothetical protein QMD85_03620, partial [Candidatus Aenigmarchaeota archaeon]|nr:hypothetical protein [Candidatus Aenigmarchaeota archaeon]MDI6722641.1 hypothetical protein [Candidatus Aenigmarchaeota archaeon]